MKAAIMKGYATGLSNTEKVTEKGRVRGKSTRAFMFKMPRRFEQRSKLALFSYSVLVIEKNKFAFLFPYSLELTAV